MFCPRTSSWMLLQPTAELPGSWWREKNMVRFDSCSNVSVSQAWQPKVMVTPSSLTAWKPSRESRRRCVHSWISWVYCLFQDHPILLALPQDPFLFLAVCNQDSLLTTLPFCRGHDYDVCLQKASLSILPWKCLCSDETD